MMRPRDVMNNIETLLEGVTLRVVPGEETERMPVRAVNDAVVALVERQDIQASIGVRTCEGTEERKAFDSSVAPW